MPGVALPFDTFLPLLIRNTLPRVRRVVSLGMIPTLALIICGFRVKLSSPLNFLKDTFTLNAAHLLTPWSPLSDDDWDALFTSPG
ncbi:hypothetical protein HK096_011663, partial [Nowakowskiella sp. JEL0078]